jgi:hypothetical protein
MKTNGLQYYLHDGPTAFRFEVVGNLNHEGARRLEQNWRTASSMARGRPLIVDLTLVTGVDEEGKALITRWHRGGAWLIANSKASRTLAEAILGEALPEPPPNARDATVRRRAGLPFGASFLARAVTIGLMATLIFPIEANAATLKPETVIAWNDYLQMANQNLQDRVRPGGSFLWTLENAQRAAKVRSGEIVVAPAPGQDPKKVPGGLIHHWMGAMFLANVKLDDILQVTRDYDHYQEFYRPSVIESKAIAHSNSDDRFSMRLMNKTLFLKNVLAADYQVTNVRLDERRSYSISTTTRVQEIEEYGEPGEHQIAEGEGCGYIWKLYSIARLEQRDGGVYVELEAIALSRDIPVALRLVVDPIVHRVSRNSLLISLQQTEEAVDGRYANIAKSAVPTSGEQVPDVPASLSNKSAAFTRVH